VNDPLIARFAAACGATGPLDLRVDLADGGVLAEGTVPMPFTLVGRDDACDVTLTDAEVNPRHAWLQVVGGRVFGIDLGSRTGLGWPGGATGSGWMDADTPARIGPFLVRLRTPVSDRPSYFAPGYSPLQSDLGLKSRPTVTLEFRNGRRAKDRWSVNRLITLVGRAPECKIHLTADDIAGYHCGLVLTPDGLWVVDLSGRGVVVNGERMRVSPLRHAAELWVGRFLIGVQYPQNSLTPAPTRGGTPTPPRSYTGLSAAPLQIPAGPPTRPAVDRPQAAPEDEVPLGVVSPSDVGAGGLPSSHIMADAFRVWTGGPASHPILVANSGPPLLSPPSGPPRPAGPPPASDPFLTPPPVLAAPTDRLDTSGEVALLLLRQLGELHAQMFTQFQQSMVLLVRLFGCLRREQLPSVQRELGRIQELNAELAQLQAEVARRAAEASPAGPRSGPRLTAPAPEVAGARPAQSSPHATALHEWVIDRISTLQRERQARWQSLVGMFGEQTA
jgi:pSer/pThr/pTyr-binding forkhead associated (FHA) protein